MAEAYFRAHEYAIITRNYRCRAGEMDLIVEQDGTLVFVEVRTRRGTAAGTPEESITPTKSQRLIRVAETYRQSQRAPMESWRIDVVAIVVNERGRLVRLSHIPHAVER
ncbi:MAG: hypothetical protein CL878_15790 [Dehalococcoidia bacterium]|nr:hypothetical protein [Dehalococcoidia bacterium]